MGEGWVFRGKEMKKIFDKVIESVDHGFSDAKLTKEGYEKWTWNIEHKKMIDGKQYRVVIYELEEIK